MQSAATLPFTRDLISQLYIPLGLILLVGTLCSFFRGVDLLIALAGAVLLLAYIVFLLVRIASGFWSGNRHGASVKLGGLGLAAILAWPTMMAGDYVHMGLMLPLYSAKLVNAGDQEIAFNWGMDGFVGATTEYILVYDRTGRAAKPFTIKSPSTDARYPVGVRRLIGSFYLRTIFYS